MGIIYIAAAFFLISIPFLLRPSLKVFRIRGIIIPILCILFIVSLILFSDTAIESALKGLNLWARVVLPSLFPFFAASELLNRTGFINSAGRFLEPIMRPLFNVPGCGSFPFALSITSGCPVGAKLTAEMRQQRLISKTEAERLLAFTSNSGPLFIVGAVASGMFKIPQIGIFLLICHIAASITVGILFRFYNKKKDKNKKKTGSFKNYKTPEPSMSSIIAEKSSMNFGLAFGEAIKNSIMVMLSIGGFILIFSVIINLLLKTGAISFVSLLLFKILGPLGVNNEIITALTGGFFEITTGSSMAASAITAPLSQRIVAASMIIGWSGLSIHSQVLSIISDTDISMRPYLFGKFLQGSFAAFYTALGIKIADSCFLKSEPVFFLMEYTKNMKWHDLFITSCKYLIIILILLLIVITISTTLKLILKKLSSRLF